MKTITCEGGNLKQSGKLPCMILIDPLDDELLAHNTTKLNVVDVVIRAYLQYDLYQPGAST
jgi:hypothetical protein